MRDACRDTREWKRPFILNNYVSSTWFRSKFFLYCTLCDTCKILWPNFLSNFNNSFTILFSFKRWKRWYQITYISIFIYYLFIKNRLAIFCKNGSLTNSETHVASREYVTHIYGNTPIHFYMIIYKLLMRDAFTVFLHCTLCYGQKKP